MDDINKLLIKNKDQVVIVVIILISLIIAKNLYGRQMTKYAQLQESIRVEQEKGATLERIIDLNEKTKGLREKSWDTADANIIISKINNLGLEAKIKVTAVTPMDKRDEKTYVVIPFALSCETTYKDMVRFIRRLEKNNMLLRVRDISMAPSEAQETQNDRILLRVSFTVEAIYLK